MTEPSRNVRLQNLRNFTVQIRSPADDQIAGTGIAVSREGQVVTCAHVVKAVLGVHPREAEDGAEVGVYFPQARGGEQKARRARVAGCFPQHDDDVVLLQLVDGAPPLGPEQMPTLGHAEPSEGNPFRSYGYRRMRSYLAGNAHGTILGCVECPEGRMLQAEPVELESQQIDQGMSGAAVLDIERNLVVGLVSEVWLPRRGSQRNRDLGWAVDGHVLSLEPLNLPLQDKARDKGAAPQPRLEAEEVTAARAAVAPDLGIEWNNAPPTLEEWTGREKLLEALDRDWADPGRCVTGLIGFGGEGKSSLARQWVEGLLAGGAPPSGVFWWGFYEKPGVDEFFEAALEWLSGGRIDPRRLPGAAMRAQVLGAMLGAGRYLFVLDGLEGLQHQDGDGYGLLRSADLRAFLELFAAPGHGSFCLLTSRAPLLDLMDYTTYTHRDVERLEKGEGRALLRKLGVRGPDAALDRAVADWDGHALTLSLLGGYLAKRYGGDVNRLDDIPPPTAEEPRYERVHRVLRRYDEHLGAEERAFLTLFSAFRTPVKEGAFEKVFRQTSEVVPTGGSHETPEVRGSLAGMEEGAFAAMVGRLVTYRLLRYDEREGAYTAHPLVRNHYFTLLTAGDRAGQEDAHGRIKDYYLEVAGDTPHFPTLDDLAPLIEVVHHACRAGAYDEAWEVLWGRIYQRDLRVIIHQLGAYETNLAMMLEFFPGGDTAKEPQVSKPGAKSWILNEAGLCLMSLGRLGEAAPFFERYVAGNIELEDWHNASIGYRNLAELHAQLGALEASAGAAGEALALARRAGDKREERDSLTYRAWADHQRGDPAAGEAFREAEALEREIDPSVRYLYSIDGIRHAEHLRRGGEADYARRVTEANLEICERNRWADQVSMCHRVLGDLDAEEGDREGARGHYQQALKIARGISVRDVLIEALLARGRLEPGLEQGLADLEEALGYAVEGGYQVYEADIRAGLARAHGARGDVGRAQAEAARARQLSAEMGYYWGRVEAESLMGTEGR